MGHATRKVLSVWRYADTLGEHGENEAQPSVTRERLLLIAPDHSRLIRPDFIEAIRIRVCVWTVQTTGVSLCNYPVPRLGSLGSRATLDKLVMPPRKGPCSPVTGANTAPQTPPPAYTPCIPPTTLTEKCVESVTVASKPSGSPRKHRHSTQANHVARDKVGRGLLKERCSLGPHNLIILSRAYGYLAQIAMRRPIAALQFSPSP